MVRNKEPAFTDAARVVELADTPDLGSGSARIGGSSPLARTNFANIIDDLGTCRTASAQILKPA